MAPAAGATIAATEVAAATAAAVAAAAAGTAVAFSLVRRQAASRILLLTIAKTRFLVLELVALASVAVDEVTMLRLSQYRRGLLYRTG